MKNLIILTIAFVPLICFAQTEKIEVLTLGTFHFAFHNRDVKKTDETDQIDVLDKKYQDEIEEIVNQLILFEPTIVVIEEDPKEQKIVDSLYNSYVKSEYELNREEDQQIGFRIAKKLGLKKLYCANDWGKNYREIDSLLENDSLATEKFKQFFYDNPDLSQMFYGKDVFKEEGIKAQLRLLNDNENIQKSLGNYMIGVFKYEVPDEDFFGADFTTGWWFNRNLRIFRNIQKIETTSKDRILVIYGAGHMNLLNIFFEASPEYNLVRTNDFLK